ncbi:MAG: galactokinase family protein [Gemmatimonadales bacterium]
MTRTLAARVGALGLHGRSALLATERFAEVERRFAERFGHIAAARAWWVPGRIEVLGKHTDYGGGRSLLAAVERGFHVVARPRSDGLIRLLDASSNAMLSVPLAADVEPRPGHWTDYPISVIRRLARDFPRATTGLDMVIRSSLPAASGLSSSSALVIATFLPLAAVNNLRETPEWRAAFANDDAVAGYLGAVENGRVYGSFPADRGVGTHGGSEDHTAILRCSPGRLSQYHFLPVTPEAELALPAGWTFVVGVSGVHAAKAGRVQAHYNALSGQLSTLLALWCEATGRSDPSLFAALRSAPDAPLRISEMAAATSAALAARLAQFRDEVEEIIPGVVAALGNGDLERVGELVARSQAHAERTLANQVPETVHLVQSALARGAAAASAFGAGFGGSVWALVPDALAAQFRAAWLEDYVEHFPQHQQRADAFLSAPGPAATEL